MIALPFDQCRPISRMVTRLLFAAAFLLLFWPTFRWMIERFDASDSFYSHGWLVPLASGWLVWQRRARLSACESSASMWGLALLAPCILLQVLAARLSVHFVSGLAMVGVVAGLCWTLAGAWVLRVLAFPILFLLFMVPLPGILLIGISFKLKLLAAAVATKAVTWFGIAATQAGSIVCLPGVTVIIDDTCSGLRSLISLLALSTLWTSFLGDQARGWQRLTLLAAALPLAIGANAVRLVLLMLLAVFCGPAMAEGFVHYWSGIVVFGVAVAVLAWLGNRLALIGVPAEMVRP